MAAKEEKPLKISAVSVDKSLEDWKKVKALYKESFTSAQRAPFRSLMAQPEEGKSSLTAYHAKSSDFPTPIRRATSLTFRTSLSRIARKTRKP